MGKIIEAAELPHEEKIYLKKDFLGWRVVEPIIDPETKKFIWKNFFNKKGFIALLFILMLLGVCYLAFKEQVDNYKRVMNEPCSFCKDCQAQARKVLESYQQTYKPEADFSEVKFPNVNS